MLKDSRVYGQIMLELTKRIIVRHFSSEAKETSVAELSHVVAGRWGGVYLIMVSKARLPDRKPACRF